MRRYCNRFHIVTGRWIKYQNFSLIIGTCGFNLTGSGNKTCTFNFNSVRIGGLFSKSSAITIQQLAAVRIAINTKNEIVAGQQQLLPRTKVLFTHADTEFDSAKTLLSTFKMSLSSFNGVGVDGIIGAGTNAASVNAAMISNVGKTPMIDYGGTAMRLSKRFPYYSRVVPTAAEEMNALVNTINKNFNWKQVVVISSTDIDSEDQTEEFKRLASTAGVKVKTVITIKPDTKTFTKQIQQLADTGVAVVVWLCDSSFVTPFVQQAQTSQLQVLGNGYQSIITITTLYSFMISPPKSIGLKGFIGLDIGASLVGSEYTKLKLKFNNYTNSFNSSLCNSETDDEGNMLWIKKTSSGTTCTQPVAGQTMYTSTAYAYDAAYTMLYAMHKLIEVDKVESLTSSSLMNAIIQSNINGASGNIRFNSGDSDNKYKRGDRLFSDYKYILRNHNGVFFNQVAGYRDVVGLQFPYPIYRNVNAFVYNTTTGLPPTDETSVKTFGKCTTSSSCRSGSCKENCCSNDVTEHCSTCMTTTGKCRQCKQSYTINSQGKCEKVARVSTPGDWYCAAWNGGKKTMSITM